jgi:hypothetical protein
MPRSSRRDKMAEPITPPPIVPSLIDIDYFHYVKVLEN